MWVGVDYGHNRGDPFPGQYELIEQRLFCDVGFKRTMLGPLEIMIERSRACHIDEICKNSLCFELLLGCQGLGDLGATG